MRLDGLDIELDIEADLAMGDLSEDMDAIAGQIAWYGRVLAGARRVLDNATDNGKIVVARVMEDRFARNPKEGVEKAKTAAEAHEDYAKTRKSIAAARELVGRLDAAYTALQVKADILRSKGALARSELNATEMTTAGGPGSRQRPTEETNRRVADAMRRRRSREDDGKPDEDDED
jgi:hypothetical protein